MFQKNPLKKCISTNCGYAPIHKLSEIDYIWYCDKCYQDFRKKTTTILQDILLQIGFIEQMRRFETRTDFIKANILITFSNKLGWRMYDKSDFRKEEITNIHFDFQTFLLSDISKKYLLQAIEENIKQL
jgi:hypothetical protein